MPPGMGRGRKFFAHICALMLFSTIIVVVAPPAPAGAAPGRETYVTMVADRGEHITGGASELYHAANSDIRIESHGESVYVYVDDRDATDYEFRFLERYGVKLQEGTYAVDQPKQPGEWWDKRSPGISIERHGGSQEDDRSCSVVTGRFTVKDIARRKGRVTRLWIVYEHRCDGEAPISGEIRYRMPSDDGQLMVGPRTVRYPTVPVGGTAPVTPVRAANTSTVPVSVTGVSLSGGPDHSIRYDGCSKTTVAPGQSCAVWLSFAPTNEGAQNAVLEIQESGLVHKTRVNGRALGVGGMSFIGQPGAPVGGTSDRFTFSSEPGDPIGGGEAGEIDLWIDAWGDHRGISVLVDLAGRDDWTFDFVPPKGDVLLPGLTYSNVRGAEPLAQTPWVDLPDTDEGAGMHVTRRDERCDTVAGTFSIHELRLNEAGEVTEFAASFEQFCDGASTALRGRVDVRTWAYEG